MARRLLSQGLHSYWVHLILSFCCVDPRTQVIRLGIRSLQCQAILMVHVEFILISAETPLCLQDWVYTWTQRLLLIFFPYKWLCIACMIFPWDISWPPEEAHRLCHFISKWVRDVLQQVTQSNSLAVSVCGQGWHAPPPPVLCAIVQSAEIRSIKRNQQTSSL